jgi:4'-phosphopantetheinyl transferase EntD
LASYSDSITWPIRLFPNADAVLLVDLISNNQLELIGEESALANGVTETRLRELRAGRTLARHALSCIGKSQATILSSNSGAPLWPEGVVGSLSHTIEHAAVFVALQSSYGAVGVDIDDKRPLGDAATADIAIADEIELVERLGFAPNRLVAQNLVFNAKEAIFKCQFPLTQSISLDFHDVHLIAGNDSASLRVEGRNCPTRIERVLENIYIFPIYIQSLRFVYAISRASQISV